MPQRACEECGEMVDDAKAFCPSCGHAFVEEERRAQPSEFERMEGTQQFGKTMYNQMLSDMGLNLKADPSQKSPPKVQVIQAVPATRTIEPAAAPASNAPQPSAPAKGTNKLLIFGIIAAFLILGLLVAVAAAVFLWWRFA
jgi:uncharacterized Zn finger protein (UPF0148 family)